jgi:hypothetical protein
MHKRNKAIVVAMVTGLLMAAALPAQAQQVPFSVDLPVTGGFGVGISPDETSSGFVGGCDVQLRCSGASVRVRNTEGGVEVGGVEVHLAGAVCVLDQTAPCGSPGDPGTGFVFTRRDLLLGSSGVEVPDFEIEYCVWRLAPRTAPTECTVTPVDGDNLAPVSTKTNSSSLGGVIPERVIIGPISN